MQVSPEYFAVAGLRLLQGRLYASRRADDTTRHSPAEMVVNASMARTVWPGEDPIGKCMVMFAPTEPCTFVTGVVNDAHLSSVVQLPTMTFYIPVTRPSTIVLRSAPGRTPVVAAEVGRALRQRFPYGDPPYVSAMVDALAPQYRPWRLGAVLFTSFGLLALLVAIVGIYSVTVHEVTQRTREMGVRVALGARAPDVLRQVVRDSVRPVLAGVLIGAGAALLAARAIAALVYGTSPYDPVSLAIVSLLLVVATMAAIAAGIPATRADPLQAIRAE